MTYFACTKAEIFLPSITDSVSLNTKLYEIAELIVDNLQHRTEEVDHMVCLVERVLDNDADNRLEACFNILKSYLSAIYYSNEGVQLTITSHSGDDTSDDDVLYQLVSSLLPLSASRHCIAYDITYDSCVGLDSSAIICQFVNNQFCMLPISKCLQELDD